MKMETLQMLLQMNTYMYVYIYIYMYIDKDGLEYLITFHEAEFEIIGGYCFNQGRFGRINKVIKSMV